jgi:hypothetical protein
MGEARRRKSVATGTVHIVANGHHCFSFTLTRAEAISVEERFFQLMKANGYDAEDYADKVLGFLVTWGLPQEGDPYPGPMYAGEYITAADLDMLKSATLYQVMRQQDPDGKRILDVFAGKELGVVLEGDPDTFKRYAELEAKGFPCEKVELRLTIVAVGSDGKPAAQPVPLH